MLQFTIPVAELKSRGYKFQKLFAMDYKTYRKHFGERKYSGHTIWLWVSGSMLMIDDWHDATPDIIKFYKENRHQIYEMIKEAGYKEHYNVLHLALNNEDYSIKMMPYFDRSDSGYPEWREVNISIKDFDEVLKEVEYLTK